MKSVNDILLIPKIRLFLPDVYTGIARFKLRATKHTQHVRVVFSWRDGLDVAMVMFKQGKRPTPEEVEEVKQHFFRPEEIPQCVVGLHPDNDLIAVIYRLQEEGEDPNGS